MVMITRGLRVMVMQLFVVKTGGSSMAPRANMAAAALVFRGRGRLDRWC